MKKILVVGVSGASGISLTITLLKELRKHKDYEIHLVMSNAAKRTLEEETPFSCDKLYTLVDCVYDNENIGASIASGSFSVEGMIVLPCSMKTLAGITHGYSDNLLLRACDVTIKEHRKLILGVRETPLSPIHLKNMYELSLLSNVFIFPMMMVHYHNPKTLVQMELQIVGKILSYFNISVEGYKRWQ